MEPILRDAVSQIEDGRQIVLATVVSTSGSTPQKSGATLLVRSDGRAAGSLGGGCVENDIVLAGRELLASGGRAELHTYVLNEDLELDGGLVCGGTMVCLLDPIDPADASAAFLREALAACDGGIAVAIGTLTAASPASGLRVGAKILVRENGTSAGSLGDAELDSDAVRRARHLLAVRQRQTVSRPDGAEYSLETWTVPPMLIIAGGGHIGQALDPIARSVGFRTVIVDDRAEYANRQRFPHADQVVAQDFVTALEALPIGPNTCIVVATRGHRHDDVALEAAARTQARYVALLGSRRKTILIFEALLGRGISRERLQQVRAPVGLDIGARTPEEIAIAIVAEILMFRLGGTGAPLKLADRHLQGTRRSPSEALSARSSREHHGTP